MRFDTYHRPESVAECSGLLKEYGSRAKLVAGGTDLVPRLRSRAWRPDAVIDISRIPGLDRIAVSETGLELGSMARLRKISLDPALEADYQVVREAAGHVSSMQVRNVATIGGNVCNASPSADAVQGLMVTDAVAVIGSASGKREVPIADFFTGPGTTVLAEDELLIALKIPAPAPRTGACYEKFAIRGDTDISIVGAAASLTLDEEGRVARARISLAAVAPTPLRAPEAEALLEGKEPGEDLLRQAAELAAAAVTPISDQRASAAYRVEMVRVWTRKALETALDRARAKQPSAAR